MELKDLLSTIGIEDVKTVDEFKEKFTSKFISRSSIQDDDEARSAFTGKFTSVVKQLLKKEFGVDGSEIKDLQWEDQLKLVAKKQKEKMQELEELSGKGNDDKLNELTAKLQKAEKTILDYKTNLENTSKLVEQKESEYTGKIKDLKVGYLFTDAKSKVLPKLKSNMSEAEQIGFEAKLKDSFQVDFDEQDNIIVLGKDGKRLQNPNKVGQFMTLEEAIEDVAAKLSLVKQNNVAQTNVKSIIPNTTPATATPTANGKQINPAFLERRRKLGLE